jgi:hypothetical protein
LIIDISWSWTLFAEWTAPQPKITDFGRSTRAKQCFANNARSTPGHHHLFIELNTHSTLIWSQTGSRFEL